MTRGGVLQLANMLPYSRLGQQKPAPSYEECAKHSEPNGVEDGRFQMPKEAEFVACHRASKRYFALQQR
jgi:hypothetical protein